MYDQLCFAGAEGLNEQRFGFFERKVQAAAERMLVGLRRIGHQLQRVAPDLLKAIRHRFPWLRHVFADGGYAGHKLRNALKGHGNWTTELIKRPDTAKSFEVLPRRCLR